MAFDSLLDVATKDSVTCFRKRVKMADTTEIEWTSATWNPVTGCTKVSPGCDHCYAERFAERWRGVKGNYFENGFDLTLRPLMLDRPGRWQRGRFVFVNSMSDLFHRDVPDGYIDRVFDVMERIDQHVYQILTKRPERMRRYIRRRFENKDVPEHIWLGVTVENNAYAWRVKMLQDCPASVRFLSVEPMIGSVGRIPLKKIDWVIAGGESGPGKRAMDPTWVRALRDRCVALRIPFFFKQWHKAGTGRVLDGRIWDQMPTHSIT